MSVLHWLRWLLAKPNHVSIAWLKNQDRHDATRGIEQVMQFPVKKFINEHALYQTRKLRQDA